MNVFISWSGASSFVVAEALRDWLPMIINAAKPFLSAADIDKGSRWGSEIAAKLESARTGIICLTPSNLHADWILFEAGALAKTVENTFVCTLLIGLEPSAVNYPLAQFQATRAVKKEILLLLKTLNKALGEEALTDAHIEKSFEVWWPHLESVFKKLPPDDVAVTPKRDERDLLEEILGFVRNLNRPAPESVAPAKSQSTGQQLINLIERYVSGFHEEGVPLSNVVKHCRGRGSPFPPALVDLIIDHMIQYGLMTLESVDDKKILKWNFAPGHHFQVASFIEHWDDIQARAEVLNDTDFTP